MSTSNVDDIIKRGVAEIIFENDFRDMLKSGKRLRLKQGFDPSRPDIHLGHVVGLRKLRQLQELGHQLVLIVGDWTARIGDPSGQSATRKMLTVEEVNANARTYMEQFFKVVDKDKTEVRYQSEWYDRFSLEDVIRLTSRFTVAQFLAREDFSKRFAAGHPIAITELLYPLLQGYDSVVVNADVEFGGIDQKFNCLVAREVQQLAGQRPEQVFLMPLLVGTDGTHKMSKSLGNYVGITEPPQDMYGKIMSIPDNLIVDYFELLTDVPQNEITAYREGMAGGGLNPMVAKKRLAAEIVAQFHGKPAALEADQHFTRVFSRREVPDEVPEYPVPAAATTVGIDAAELMVSAGTASSRAEAKRLLAQRAVEIDGKTVTPGNIRVNDGSLLRVGKRRFVRLVQKAADSDAGSVADRADTP